jgi:hypothetical protein
MISNARGRDAPRHAFSDLASRTHIRRVYAMRNCAAKTLTLKKKYVIE